MPSTIDAGSLASFGITIYGAEASDFSGSSVSGAGDFNGDGFDDLIIGAGRGERSGDVKLTSGRSALILGCTNLPLMIDLFTLGTYGSTILGVDLGDLCGQTVSNVGDLNGDGFNDIVVAATGGDGAGNGNLGAGESYVIYGTGNLPPQFTSSATVNVNENETTIITVVAVDSETAPLAITYSISGGVDQTRFSITSGGLLKFTTARNFENPTDFDANNVYLVQVTADDGQGGTTIQNMTVTVTDVNDAPVFQSGSVVNHLEDQSFVGTTVATDADLPAQTVTYSITGGDDQTQFSITNNGNLTFITAPDYQNPTDVGANNIYNVQVTANDGAGGLTFHNLVISVSAVNFNAPIFATSATLTVAENSTSVATVLATDADLPAQAIIYFITGGADQARFSISNGGVLTFIAAPNFENPTDSNADNIYTLQVTANDGNGGLTVQAISVTVTDVNEVLNLELGGPAVTWINRRGAVKTLPLATVSGNATLKGGTLTISVNAVSTVGRLLDKFVFPSSNAFGSTTGAQFANGRVTLQVQLGQNASTSGIQSYLRGITFNSKGKGVNTLTRTMDVTLTTADGLSRTIRQTINVRKRA